ncbi:unnamed protein product [Lactuca virosa]|uniref:Ubiquitin-like protease family profile domain-containing protein n=1 Tax=Lactuca virosa TaxID=75947 RepID=A0AAU9MEQ0_9ASTR|nr:unnamed protein product [Lactuca virosa]
MEHLFVFVFNIKNASIVILDNNISAATIKDKYMLVLKNLKKYFLRYLHEINHPRCHALEDPDIKPQIPHLLCKTKDNKTNCGVFVMRYMETYMGETDYKTGFPKEGTQDALLDWVRTKYAYALISS